MLRSIISLFLLFPVLLVAETEAFTFDGHLSTEIAAQAKSTLDKKPAPETLILTIDSTSGELREVLELAKEIYALKINNGTRVIVYISENAVGPAALLPFLADELYISFFVSWGDIALGTDKSIPTHLLRSQVTSLIARDQPHAKELKLLAAAMADPSQQIVEKDGWRLQKGEDLTGVVSAVGEALVVNHDQLRALDLIKGTVSATRFRELFAQPEKVEKPKAKGEARKGVDARLKEHIRFNSDGPNTVGLINIDNRTTGINQSTWIYVKTALDYYKEKKPAFVILRLNTPGGEVFAAQKISDALKELDTQYNIPVVAFIDNWAISAGAMLAYSCRFITVVKDGSMGAAEPVFAGESGKMETAPEKVNSALRADFANRARFFDRNPDVAEAMVDKDIILVYRHGKIVRLDREEQIRTSGPDPDKIITAKGKLLTLSAAESMQYGVADILLPPQKLPLITEKERAAGKWPAEKTLVFEYPFFKEIPQATIDEYQMDWRTLFFVILAHPIVASMLFLGMMVGFYVEINTPGFGVPGSVGLICLFLIVLSSFALDVANWLEVILLCVGIILIAMDLFVTPTFGLLGGAGALLAIIGLFGMMLPGIGAIDFEFDTQTFNAAGEAFFKRLAWLCGTFVLGLVIIAMLGRYVMPSFAMFSRFVLAGHEETDYIAGEDPTKLPGPGTSGKVVATLRPAGKVMIDGTIYDAVTAGDFIDSGVAIEVEQLDGSVMVVKRKGE